MAEEQKNSELGRPPVFETPEEMQEVADTYFEIEDRHSRKPTISGLCYFLGFESRQSFYDYEKRDAFSYTIKRLRLRIEWVYESNLHGNSNAGSIFALKNFGWTDRQEIDHTTQGDKIAPFVLNVKPDRE